MGLIESISVDVTINQRVSCRYGIKKVAERNVFFAEWYRVLLSSKGVRVYCLLVPGAGIEPARAF